MNRSPERKERSLWLRVGRRLLFVLCAFFVVRTFYRLLAQFDPASLRFENGLWLLGLPLSALAMWFQYGAWWELYRNHCRDVSSEREPSALARYQLYLTSQLARYTPGKVGLLALRVSEGTKLGLRARSVVISTVIELLSWLLTGVLFSLVLLLALKDKWRLALEKVVELGWLESEQAEQLAAGGFVLLLLGALSVALILLLACQDLSRFSFLTRLKQRLLRQGAGDAAGADFASDRSFFTWRALGYHLLFWMSWWLAGVVSLLSFGVQLGDAAWAAGALPLGILGGFFALFAPGGAGIREALISSMALPVLGASLALSFSLLMRLFSLFTEVTIFLTLRVWLKRKSIPVGEASQDRDE